MGAYPFLPLSVSGASPDRTSPAHQCPLVDTPHLAHRLLSDVRASKKQATKHSLPFTSGKEEDSPQCDKSGSVPNYTHLSVVPCKEIFARRQRGQHHLSENRGTRLSRIKKSESWCKIQVLLNLHLGWEG